MDYEKKYNEMVRRAKELHESGNALTRQQMEIVCPELTESEDERIIRLLRELGSLDAAKELYEEFNLSYTNVLYWLEKQKENIEKEYVFRPLTGTDITIAAEQAIRRANEGDCLVLAFNGAYIPVRKGCNANKIVDIYDAYLEKQKEQKPADKDAAELTPKQDYSGLTDFERAIHRGFLCAGVENVPVEIIKETAQDCITHIEHKPAEWSGVNDLVFRDICKHLKEEGYGGWVVLLETLRDGVFQFKQKRSEEDERILKGIIGKIDHDQTYGVSKLEMLSFLEKLRPQPKPEWSEEDKSNLQSCIAKIEIDMQHWDKHGKTMVDGDIKLIDWLKALPERFELQPKQERDEQEEEAHITDNKTFFNWIYDRLLYVYKEDENVDYMRSFRKRIESLFSKPHWKPSEEQMGALKECGECKRCIKQLYEQLKKL